MFSFSIRKVRGSRASSGEEAPPPCGSVAVYVGLVTVMLYCPRVVIPVAITAVVVVGVTVSLDSIIVALVTVIVTLVPVSLASPALRLRAHCQAERGRQ